jgi:hypothetical protein
MMGGNINGFLGLIDFRNMHSSLLCQPSRVGVVSPPQKVHGLVIQTDIDPGRRAK